MKDWKNNLKSDDDELVTSYFSAFFKIEIPIRFIGTADEVRPNQEALVTEMIEYEDRWIEESIRAILEYYKEVYPDYRMGWELNGSDDVTIEQYLPEEIDREKLLKLITPSELFIAEEENYEPGRFGFGLECEWDIEHGLGVSFNQWKASEVGGMDVAFGI